MRLSHEDLIDIMAEASHRLNSEIRRAFKNGSLENYLSNIGMGDIYPVEEETPLYDTDPNGKILIIGDGMIKEHVIYGCLKDFNIPKERIETYLDYESAKNFSFNRIQYNPNYRLILFGAVPHSGKGKHDKSSIISQIESDDGYPKVVRLTDSHGLKMTKTSLKDAIHKEIISGYLAV